MLLNDIGKSPDTTLRKINQHLETNYGFRIAEDVSDRDLVAIMEQIEEEITELKIQGNDSGVSPDISKRLLILEGLKTLREFAVLQFQSPDLEKVISSLCDFVCKQFTLGGMHHADLDDAIKDAMKEYRSSRYRFPDDMIEQRVRSGAERKLQNMDSGGLLGSPINTETMFEGDNWGSVGKRAGAFGGHAADPNTASAKATLQKLAAPVPGSTQDNSLDQLSLEPMDGIDGPDAIGGEPRMVRNRNGVMVPNPLYIHAKNRQTGYVPESKIDEKLAVIPSSGKRQTDHTKTGSSAQMAARKQQADDLRKDKATGKEKNPGAVGSKTLRGTGATVMKNYDAKKSAKEYNNMYNEGTVMRERSNLVKNLRRLLETEVQEAEVMMSAKNFSKELQEMIEKIGRLQNEDLPPCVDSMRNTFGNDTSSAFQTQIYGAMQGVMDSLYTAKSQVDDAVSSMAAHGQLGATTDMDVPVGGMDAAQPPAVDPNADPNVDVSVDANVDADLDNIEGDMAAADEFGGAEEEEPLGRAMKEAKLQRKVMEMRKLVQKARALREAQEEVEMDEALRATWGGEYPRSQDDRSNLASHIRNQRTLNRQERDENPPQRRGGESAGSHMKRKQDQKSAVRGVNSIRGGSARMKQVE